VRSCVRRIGGSRTAGATDACRCSWNFINWISATSGCVCASRRGSAAWLADAGQQMPIVVVIGGSAYVVVDGHKRVRCLRQLHCDTVAAVLWEMSEAEALIFRQLLHTEATNSALEQGWLLRTLHEDHGLALDALARRFDRSVSWVSRRVNLVRTLPEAIQ
jgi:ParB family transcriptional regulator, chromosome partitioning protein